MEEMFSTCVQDNNTRNTCNFTQKLSQPYRKMALAQYRTPLFLFLIMTGRSFLKCAPISINDMREPKRKKYNTMLPTFGIGLVACDLVRDLVHALRTTYLPL